MPIKKEKVSIAKYDALLMVMKPGEVLRQAFGIERNHRNYNVYVRLLKRRQMYPSHLSEFQALMHSKMFAYERITEERIYDVINDFRGSIICEQLKLTGKDKITYRIKEKRFTDLEIKVLITFIKSIEAA